MCMIERISGVSHEGERNDANEFDTQPRHSLTYELIGTVDRFVKHPSTVSHNARTTSNAVRLVEYSDVNEEQLAVRSMLVDRGLVLGALLTDEEDEKQVFRIPRSARPIKHESSVQASSHFSYNDAEIFFGVGSMVGILRDLDNEQRVLIGDIGMLVTMIEFTPPNQKPLSLAPGVEKAIVSLPAAVNPTEYYIEKLTAEFGDRFNWNKESFIEGFDRGL